ncbi:MAG: hypothetical protein AMXMBFR64_04150 [Myxococcales bacterium]
MDVTPYLENLRRMDRELRAAEVRRAEEARTRLPGVVEVLVALGARRVILFGSLRTGRLHDRSDIDVAVDGVPADRYWEALWRCAEVAGRHVDLVLLSEASDSLRERIAEDGEVLHG